MKKETMILVALMSTTAHATSPVSYGPKILEGSWEIQKFGDSRVCKIFLGNKYDVKLQGYTAKGSKSCQSLIGGNLVAWVGGTDSITFKLIKIGESNPSYIKFEAENIRKIDTGDFVSKNLRMSRSPK